MRRSLLLLLSLSLASCSKAQAQPVDDPLVVHEWGTFTSFEGADGVTVDGMQHETEPLPSFVASRLSPQTSPLAIYGDASRDVPVRRCRGKMETPVIYFHTKQARHVSVHVDFQGLLTQWYPRASRTTPIFTGSEQHDLGAVASSSLEWELDLVPRGGPAPPRVDGASDWQKAREVDAALVKSGDDAERYVFYRGLMKSIAQPRIVAAEGGRVRVTTPSPIAAAFALEMREDVGRFVALGPTAGDRDVTLDAPMRPKKEVVAALAAAMKDALVKDGLYDDEAVAMIRTWTPTWFATEGTRVVYLVPRSITDATLPLRISPTPAALVRTLVGRVEYLAPERRVALEAAVRAAAYDDDAAAFRAIAKLGRFAEPAVRSVQTGARDEATRDAATLVLPHITSM
ncbi:MAG TPA: hypothetical protein VIF62_06365 [Labilithrix sp.]